jgi:hypothetical protein
MNFSIYLILQAALSPAVYSASNRNDNQKQKNNLGSRVRPVHKADKFTAIPEHFVWIVWDSQHLTTRGLS